VQANHFVTVTPTGFGVSLRHLQGVLDCIFVTHQHDTSSYWLWRHSFYT